MEESHRDWVVLVVLEPDAEGRVLLLKAELVERRCLIVLRALCSCPTLRPRSSDLPDASG
jgi:hypothetical protein